MTYKGAAPHHWIIAKRKQSLETIPTRLKTDILEGTRTLQRLLAQQNSKIASLKVGHLMDSTIVKTNEDSGFFEKMNAEYGGR